MSEVTSTSPYMRRALALAEQAVGSTSPNPPVGSVVVRGDATVGAGYTQPPGGPHAEVLALQEAGALTDGATLYVTLEPCDHQGRTAPCTEAIIAAGVSRVVFSLVDPDARVSGRGRARLEAVGITTEVGDGAAESARVLEGYLKHRRTGRPFVIAKFVASLDGRIAAASGDSRWVSGPDTLAWAHALRTKIDAIMVGSENVIADDPRLTARPGGVEAERQPLRVVADSRGRVAPGAAVLAGPARTLVATTERSDPAWRERLAAGCNVEVAVYPAGRDGRVSLEPLLQDLGSRGVLKLLVEGGGVLHGSFFDARLVDKVHAVLAPMIIGASAAASAVAGRGAERMADALRLHDVTVERVGEDILVTGYPGEES